MVAQQQVQRRGAGACLFQSLFSLCRARAVVEQVVLGAYDTPVLIKKTKINKKSQVRTNTGAKTPSGEASDHGDHHSPYDTVSGSEDDDTRIEEVPLRGGPASNILPKQDQQPVSPQRRTFHLPPPTREIVPTNNGGGMTEVSFLTIDPILLTVSTEPSPPYRYRNDRTKQSPTSTSRGSVGDDGRPRRDEYDDDNDDDSSYDDRDDDDDDDISDITGFRDYSLISM
jgi:hypothetical protein